MSHHGRARSYEDDPAIALITTTASINLNRIVFRPLASRKTRSHLSLSSIRTENFVNLEDWREGEGKRKHGKPIRAPEQG